MDVPGPPPGIRSFFRAGAGGSRWLWVTAGVALLLILSRLGAGLFENSIGKDWPGRQAEIDSTKAAAIQRAFALRTAQPFNAVREMCRTSSRLFQEFVTNRKEEAAEQVFALFREWSASGLSLELYDGAGNLLAYEGRPLGLDTLRLNAIHSPGGIISREAFFTYYIFAQPVADSLGTHCALLLGAIPLETAFPLHNRILQSSGFRSDIRDEMNIDLAVDYDGGDDRAKDGRYYAVLLRGAEGRPAATGYFLKTSPGAYLPFVRSRFQMVTSFLALLLIALLSLPLARWYGSAVHGNPVRAAAATLHIWGVRYLFLLLAVPQNLLPESLFNPVHFASDFGWGITSSPGELLLTALCLFVNGVVLLRLSVDTSGRISADSKKRVSLSIAGMFLLICLLPLLVRSYAATIHSFVADSTFQFEDVSSIFEQPLYILMLASIFLVTAGMALACAALLSAAGRLCRDLPWPRQGRIAGAAIVTAAAFPAMYFGMRDPLYPPAVYLVSAVCAFALVAFPIPARWLAPGGSLLSRAFLLGMAVLALFVPTLTRSIDQKRADAVVLMAREYTQPVDGWTTLLLTQTIQSLQEQAALTPEDQDEAGPQEAFHLWARSPLSSQPNHSALLYRGPAGQSRFAIGLSPGQLRRIEQEAGYRTSDTLQTCTFPHLAGSSEQAIYTAVVPLINSGGNKVGSAFVAIEAGSGVQSAGSRMDILRSASQRREIIPEDQYIFSRFSRGRLISSSDPSLPRGIPLPGQVQQEESRNPQGWWAGLPTEEGVLPTFFTRTSDTTGGSVLGISIPRVERTYFLYRIFRFGFVFLLLALAFLAAASGRNILRAFRRREFSFAARLQAAFILIAAIPITLYWVSNREFVRTRSEEQLHRRLDAALQTAERNISAPLPGAANAAGPDSLTNERCAALAAASGNEINIYSGERLSASSRPELYETGLLSPRLDGAAYREVYLRGRDQFIAHETIGAFPYLVGYKPLRGAEGKARAVIAIPLLFEQQTVEEEYARATATFFLWSFVGFVLILLISSLVANQIARPMRELTRAAKDIALGDYSGRIPVARRDEIGEFIRAFNRMTERVAESRRELAEIERELAWKEMAKQVAHEIRNPLTPMKLAAQHLLRAYRDGATQIGSIIEQVTRTILEQIEALTRISAAFSLFARMPRRDVKPIDLASLIRETIALFAHHAGIRFLFEPDATAVTIPADRDELQRCFVNLLRNAVQAIPGEGTIAINLHPRPMDVMVEIRDTGIGIAPEIMPRILEPNFSTKTEGMGLGLPIVKKILDDMRASIEIESEPGRGTTVRLFLPLSPPGPQEESLSERVKE